MQEIKRESLKAIWKLSDSNYKLSNANGQSLFMVYMPLSDMIMIGKDETLMVLKVKNIVKGRILYKFIYNIEQDKTMAGDRDLGLYPKKNHYTIKKKIKILDMSKKIRKTDLSNNISELIQLVKNKEYLYDVREFETLIRKENATKNKILVKQMHVFEATRNAYVVVLNTLAKVEIISFDLVKSCVKSKKIDELDSNNYIHKLAVEFGGQLADKVTLAAYVTEQSDNSTDLVLKIIEYDMDQGKTLRTARHTFSFQIQDMFFLKNDILKIKTDDGKINMFNLWAIAKKPRKVSKTCTNDTSVTEFNVQMPSFIDKILMINDFMYFLVSFGSIHFVDIDRKSTVIVYEDLDGCVVDTKVSNGKYFFLYELKIVCLSLNAKDVSVIVSEHFEPMASKAGYDANLSRPLSLSRERSSKNQNSTGIDIAKNISITEHDLSPHFVIADRFCVSFSSLNFFIIGSSSRYYDSKKDLIVVSTSNFNLLNHQTIKYSDLINIGIFDACNSGHPYGIDHIYAATVNYLYASASKTKLEQKASKLKVLRLLLSSSPLIKSILDDNSNQYRFTDLDWCQVTVDNGSEYCIAVDSGNIVNFNQSGLKFCAKCKTVYELETSLRCVICLSKIF